MFSNLYRKITHFLLLLGVGFSMILVSCNDFLNVESKRIAKEDQCFPARKYLWYSHFRKPR